MVTTENDAWASWMESYKHFGMGAATERESVVFERIGTNYKLSNLQAAVGVVQMRHIDELLGQRRALAARYREAFAGRRGVAIPVTTPQGVHSYQSFCVLLAGRDGLLSRLRQRGIEAQIGTYALHRHPAYRGRGQVDVRGPMTGRPRRSTGSTLPLFHELSGADQDEVVGAVLEEFA